MSSSTERGRRSLQTEKGRRLLRTEEAAREHENLAVPAATRETEQKQKPTFKKEKKKTSAETEYDSPRRHPSPASALLLSLLLFAALASSTSSAKGEEAAAAAASKEDSSGTSKDSTISGSKIGNYSDCETPALKRMKVARKERGTGATLGEEEGRGVSADLWMCHGGCGGSGGGGVGKKINSGSGL